METGYVVPVAEPTVAGRKCEPSGISNEMDSQPQPSVGMPKPIDDLVTLLELHEADDTEEQRLMSDAATTLKQQEAEIADLKQRIYMLETITPTEQPWVERLSEARAEIERLTKGWCDEEVIAKDYAEKAAEAQAEIEKWKSGVESQGEIIARDAEEIERLRGVLNHMWTMGVSAEYVDMIRAALRESEG